MSRDLQKKKRKVNDEILEVIRNQHCCACGRPPPSDPCHIRSRGAGGHDELENLLSLCRVHHVEQHKIGFFNMSLRYPGFLKELFNKGWAFENLDRCCVKLVKV